MKKNNKKNRKLKIRLIVYFILAFLILCISTGYFIYYNLNKEPVKRFICSQILVLTGYHLDYDKFYISFDRGISFRLINAEFLKTNYLDAKIKNFYVRIKIISLFHKKIFIKKLVVEDGFLKIYYKSNKSNSSNQIQFPSFFKCEHVFIKNFILQQQKQKILVENLHIKDFSFTSWFNFLARFRIDSNFVKGKFELIGRGNFKQKKIMFSLKSNKINYKNFVFEQVDFRFRVNKNRENGEVSGLFLINKINLLKEKLYFNNFKLSFNANILKDRLVLNRSEFFLDQNKLLTFNGEIDKNKNFNISFYSEQLQLDFLKKFFSDFNEYLKYFYSGELKLNQCRIIGNLEYIKKSKIELNLEISDIRGNYNGYLFSNIAALLHYDNGLLNLKVIKGKINNSSIKFLNLYLNKNILSAEANLKINLTDLPKFDKNIDLISGYIDFNLKQLRINIDKIKKGQFFDNLKFSGSFKVTNAFLTYDYFKDIEIKKMNVSFNEKFVEVINSIVKYDKGFYSVKGMVKSYFERPVSVNFVISGDYYSDFLSKKLLKIKLASFKNFKAQVNLVGKLTDKLRLKLKSGKIIFNRSNIDVYNYKLFNVTGEINYKNNIVDINKLKLNCEGVLLNINGKIFNPFILEKQSINLDVQSNGLISLVSKPLKISKLKNIKINVKLVNNFKKIIIKKAKILFENSSLQYDKYYLSKINGLLVFEDNIAKIYNINLKLFNTEYILNGNIIEPLAKGNVFLNIRADTADAFIFENLKIPIKKIENIDADINLRGTLKPFKLNLINSKVIFKNSLVNFNNLIIMKDVVGKLFIDNQRLQIPQIEAKSFSGQLKFHGFFDFSTRIKKGYFKINGTNLDFSNFIKIDAKKEKKENFNKKDNKERIPFVKKIYDFVKDIDLNIDINLTNSILFVNLFDKIDLKVSASEKGVVIEDCKFFAGEKKYFYIEKGYLKFGKLNKFYFKSKFTGIDIRDLAIILGPKKDDFIISGTSKNCLINIKSNFKNFEKFSQNLNGGVYLNFNNGFIKKMPLIANVFSILNISQIFKFKLPDLSAHGFKYQKLIGKFLIFQGIVSTDALVLKSDSINAIYTGKIDLPKEKIDADITVYPLETIDKVIKYIPIIGFLFKSDKGKTSLLVAHVSIKGNLKEPQITVKPLKSITKKAGSIFKRIFQLPIKIFTKPEEVITPGFSKNN